MLPISQKSEDNILSAHEQTNAKRVLRAECAKLRAAISSEGYARIGRQMAELLLSSAAWKRAKCVFCYVSTPREPATGAILRAAIGEGKALCVPRVLGGGVMEAVELVSLSELAAGAMGIMEPNAGCKTVVPPENIDLCAAPCAAMSEDGARLGKGGGYYDRFFAQGFRGTALALCPEALLLPRGAIPQCEHDMPVGCIITEKRMIVVNEVNE